MPLGSALTYPFLGWSNSDFSDVAIWKHCVILQGAQDLPLYQDNFFNIKCKRSCCEMGPCVMPSVSSHAQDIFFLPRASEREKGDISQEN